jgi:hypothetical protein
MQIDPVLPDLVAAIGIAVIERLPNGRSTRSHRCRTGSKTRSTSARTARRRRSRARCHFSTSSCRGPKAWHSAGPQDRTCSVASIARKDVLLRATALMMNGRSLLLLERLTGDADTRPILQKAREAGARTRTGRATDRRDSRASRRYGTRPGAARDGLTTSSGVSSKISGAAAAAKPRLDTLPTGRGRTDERNADKSSFS